MGGRRPGEQSDPISPDSKEFLIELFDDLRADLHPGEPDTPEKAAIYDSLLAALESGRFPDDARLREYVAGFAKATDEENGYEVAVREHYALSQLTAALSKGTN